MNWDNVEQIRRARAATSEETGPEIAGSDGGKVDPGKMINQLSNPLERLVFRVRTELMNYIDSKAGGAAVNDVLLDSKSIVDAKGIARLNKSAIKKSYEANADTNAFTDADLEALSQASEDITTLQGSIGELGDEVNSVAGRVTTVENSRIKVFNFPQDLTTLDVSSYSDGQYNATLAFNAMLLDSNRDTVWAKDITLFGTIQVTSGKLAGCSLCWINTQTGQLRNVTASIDVVQFNVDQSQGVDVQIAYVGIGTSSYVLTVLEAGGSGGGGAVIEADGWNDADIIRVEASKDYSATGSGPTIAINAQDQTMSVNTGASSTISLLSGQVMIFTRSAPERTSYDYFTAMSTGTLGQTILYTLIEDSSGASLSRRAAGPFISTSTGNMTFYGQVPRVTILLSDLKFYKFVK